MLFVVFLLVVSPCAFGQTRKEGYKGWAWYDVGKDPVILLAPHGGQDKPSELPQRHTGCMVNESCVYKQGCTPQSTTSCKLTTVLDSNTIEMTNLIAKNLRKNGIQPHVVICNVSRQLIDLNREIDMACMGVEECEKLYHSWHGFALEAIKSNNGVGLVIDVHGQGHSANWTELGYLVTKTELNAANYSEVRSSIHQLQMRTGLSLKELLTGRSSMGHFISEMGYRVVPSEKIPKPDSGGYYRGGYNTDVYGSSANLEGRCTDAIQFELPKDLRFSLPKRFEKIGADLASAIQQFYEIHNYGNKNLKCTAWDVSHSKVVMFFGLILAILLRLA